MEWHWWLVIVWPAVAMVLCGIFRDSTREDFGKFLACIFWPAAPFFLAFYYLGVWIRRK